MKFIEHVKKSITAKMFLLTVTLFIVFLSITLFTQKTFFQQIYTNKKKSDIVVNVKKFKDSFQNTNDKDQILNQMKVFQSEYNTCMAIVDLSNMGFYTITTGSQVVDNKNSEIVSSIVKTMYTTGSINSILKSKGSVTYIIETGEDTSMLASIMLDSKNNMAVIGFTSITYIGEALGVIDIFYKYFLIIALVLIVILVLIYSKIISRPLRKMNTVASKMSNLDFSAKCNVNTEDEIGSLGNTLNFLSENLNSAMNSLQEANEKLQKDIDKERKLDSMRKEFIADVSHELKTPITVIKGYAEGIKDGVFTEDEQSETIDVILSESDKMSKLVKSMLELSALENENEVVSIEEVNINEIMDKNLKALSRNIEEKSLIIHSDIDDEVVIEGNNFKIDQVIRNFFTNAVRYSYEKGEVWITLKNEGDYAYVSFEDTGDPIKDEDLDKIWDKFYKADKSRNRDKGGTGLGLSIVKKILELHNARYGTKNTERGVMFYAIIPKKYKKSNE